MTEPTPIPKKRPSGPLRMQGRGYRAVTVYLKKPTANVLKLYCKTKGTSQSDFLRELAEIALRKEGLLE